MAKNYVSEFTHELLKPIKYAHAGDTQEAKTITVYAPSHRISSHVAFIEQQVAKAILEMQLKLGDKFSDDDQAKAVDKKKQKDAEQTEDEKMQDQIDSILTMLFASSEIEKCFIALEKILTFEHAGNAMAKLDDLEKLTVPLAGEVGYADMKELLGKFIANFIHTSLAS